MMEKPYSEQPEQKEKEPIDFVSIFNAKLKAIEPSTKFENEWERDGLERLGIAPLEKKIPCVVLYDMEGKSSTNELWIKDPKDCDQIQPHIEVMQEFRDYRDSRGLSDDLVTETSAGYVVVDKNNKKFIFLDKEELAEQNKKYVDLGTQRKRWENLLDKYGLEKVFGLFYAAPDDTDSLDASKSSGSRLQTIMDKSMVEQAREEKYFHSYADKYQMTNSQYLRFRLRAMSEVEGFKKYKNSPDLDNIAKEIIAEDAENK